MHNKHVCFCTHVVDYKTVSVESCQVNYKISNNIYQAQGEYTVLLLDEH